MRWTLPNILTIARLVAVPLIPVMFLFFARPWADWYAMLLFIVAALTDYLDGYLARAWKLETLFGAAMDPIADKALVMIALLVINGYAGLTPWILLPSAIIIYREVFVSGLRETLAEKARALKVTYIAKWKTTAQMVAIALIFAKGVIEHHALRDNDPGKLMWWAEASGNSGIILLWGAALLTLVTGWDYFQKALPFLREARDD
ncbi:MAG: CDP-diacylglycerol--glycerol-3-phosphate 3-phosphatidyltransferase [Rhodobacterales bacterium]|nr:MAG: CDP-diacylglycerol--glycerol-3-phosphate 3-phosphatidyltransferase [Rhodobacterales bacterium]